MFKTQVSDELAQKLARMQQQHGQQPASIAAEISEQDQQAPVTWGASAPAFGAELVKKMQQRQQAGSAVSGSGSSSHPRQMSQQPVLSELELRLQKQREKEAASSSDRM